MKVNGYEICSGANLRGIDLSGVDLRDANLCYADLAFANLSDAKLCNVNLSNADLSNANLINTDLSGTSLNCSNLFNSNLCSANLSGANLSLATLNYAKLDGTNLSDAKLPTVTMMLMARWNKVSDKLCLKLMQYDADCHGNIEAFDNWAKNSNECPMINQPFIRACNFIEKSDLWCRRTENEVAPTPYELLMQLFKEKNIKFA